MNTIEYRVRAIKRYVITRFHSEDAGDGRGQAGSETLGQFDNLATANRVATALHIAEPGSAFSTIEDDREPLGVYYAYTPEQNSAFMDVATRT